MHKTVRVSNAHNEPARTSSAWRYIRVDLELRAVGSPQRCLIRRPHVVPKRDMPALRPIQGHENDVVRMEAERLVLAIHRKRHYAVGAVPDFDDRSAVRQKRKAVRGN